MILVYVGLFCLTTVLVAYFWHANDNQYYSNAYSPIVEKAQHNRAIMEENRRNAAGESSSDEPRAAGFRERDIDKKHGDGFSTY